MPRPRRYANPGTVLANFDFTDLASGLGFVNYYGLTSNPSTSYLLSSNVEYSSGSRETSKSNGSLTVNFDSSVFNLPRVVKGNAYFSCAVVITASGTGTISATLQKVGPTGTVTDLGSGVTSESITSSNDSTMFFLELPLNTTNIAAGDKLRLAVTLVCDAAGSILIAHDPASRNSTNFPANDNYITRLKVSIPFRIDQ